MISLLIWRIGFGKNYRKSTYWRHVKFINVSLNAIRHPQSPSVVPIRRPHPYLTEFHVNCICYHFNYIFSAGMLRVLVSYDNHPAGRRMYVH